jgi:hypothetical protein
MIVQGKQMNLITPEDQQKVKQDFLRELTTAQTDVDFAAQYAYIKDGMIADPSIPSARPNRNRISISRWS